MFHRSKTALILGYYSIMTQAFKTTLEHEKNNLQKLWINTSQRLGCYFFCGILLLLPLLFSCKEQNSLNIGFEVKDEVSYQEASKIFNTFLGENKEDFFLVVEFFNFSDENYFVETYEGIFCYAYKEICFDKNGKIIASDIGEALPAPSLYRIAPKSKKSFLSAPFIGVRGSETVEVRFIVHGTTKDSTFFLKKTFKVNNEKFLY